MKKYYWLKLKEDFFRQRAIKKLRRVAGGDTYTIVYLKMLLLAMKDNGKIALDGADFSEELALEIDEEPDNVKMTVVFLINTGLMEEIGPNEMFVPAAIESVGKETDSAERVRRYRERQKAKQLETEAKEVKALQSNASNVTSNKNVTTEKEIEKDIRDKREEKERETEKEKEKPADSYEPTGKGFTPQDEQIAEQFNYMCPSYKKVGKLTKKQKDALSFLLEKYEGDLKIFKRAFFLFERHEFLKSKADEWACFNWLIKPEHFEDVLKGRIKGFNPIETKATEAHRPTQEELEAQLMAEGSFKGWDELKQAFNITDDEGETPTC